MSLLEVSLASGLTFAMLAAFMALFRVQQQNYQIALDQLRLPARGAELLSRIKGPEANLMLGFRPLTAAQQAQTAIESYALRLPMDDTAAPRAVEVRFVPASTPTELPALMRPGTLSSSDSVAPGPAVWIASQATIATVSFCSPDLVTPLGNVSVGGGIPFAIIGAAATRSLPVADSGPFSLRIRRQSVAQTYDLQWGTGPLRPVSWEAAGHFEVVGGADNQGVLTAVWSSTPPTVAVPTDDSTNVFTIRARSNVRRVICRIGMNAGPYSGKIWLRDSIFLRN